MRSLTGYLHRELPERRVDVHEIEGELDDWLQRQYPDETYDRERRIGGLKAIVYDDRQRFMEEQRRRIQQEAASLAQGYLEVAHELMRAAGNGVWNSPVGFDRVIGDVMEGVRRERHTLSRREDELAALVTDYTRLLQEGVQDNIARRKEPSHG